MRELVIYPNPILLKQSRPLTDTEISTGELALEAARDTGGIVDFEHDQLTITGLLDEMAAIMRSHDGAGLAAPQVGVNVRIVIIELPGRKAGPLALINPEILSRQGAQEGKEGCLSLPGIQVNVKRPEKITVLTQTLDGKKSDFEAQGALAKAIQHELDHLDGTLIIKRGRIVGNRRISEQLDRLEKEYKLWNERKAK
jgi:peptide deformylase